MNVRPKPSNETRPTRAPKVKGIEKMSRARIKENEEQKYIVRILASATITTSQEQK
jgi:hypothetical protein